MDEIAAKLGLCKVALFEIVLVIYIVEDYNYGILVVRIGADKSSAVWLLDFGVQVGWIFTDLLSEDTRIGTVRYTRNKVRMQLRVT